MLNTLIETFKGFFSRAFWFASFLPLVIFASLHLILTWRAFGIDIERWVNTPEGRFSYLPIAFAALVVVGYVLTPIVPVLRRVLEGELLPEWLHDRLRRERFAETRPIREKMAAAEAQFLATSGLIDESKKSSHLVKIWAARKVGNGVHDITDVPAIDAAEQDVAALRQRYDRGMPPAAENLDRAATLLEAALERNDADLDAPPAKAGEARRLHLTQRGLIALMRDCAKEADYRLQNLRLRHQTIAYSHPQATRMADTRTRVESYSREVYGVDFSYLWPRLQLSMTIGEGSQNSIADSLSRARDQVDFAVLSLALSLTLPAVWLPILFCSHNIPLFLWVGIGAPFLSWFLYELVLHSQFAFGEIVKVAIDGQRLDVLAKLGLERPKGLSVERALWERLRRAEQAPGNATSDLIYKPKPE